jgi:hypothetical protein
MQPTQRRTLQLVLGVLIGSLGAYLALVPTATVNLLGRHPPKTPSDWINLRATFGGVAIGLGAFLAWLPAARPARRTIIGLVMWLMAGIGLARLLGFVLDGHPDGRQWLWITAEIALVATCAVLLRRRPT